MSDPVANVDIEDVLSSIRRLVSNGQEKGGDASGDARDADRLVLTPSQRIDAEEAEAPDRALAGSAGLTEAHPPEIEEPEPLFPEAPESIFPDRPAQVSDAVPDHTVESGAFSPGETDAPDDTGTGQGPTPQGGDDPELDGIAAMFARHESAVPGGWEPDGNDEDAFADGAEAPLLDWRDAGRDNETDEPIGDARDAAWPEPRGDRAAPLDQDWEADAPDDDENAFAIEDEAVLDEEALRDLVAEIVREELMGTLGERITRNVRKLVRREIHRALNSQDFY